MGYSLIAYIAISYIGSVPLMKWTPVEKFYATNLETALAECMKAGNELKAKKFKCVKIYE